MSQSLPRVIKRKEEIEETIQQGEKRKGKYLLGFVHPSSQEDFSFCILINSKIKKAVERNRIKRVLREIVRKNKEIFRTKGRIALLYISSSAETSYTKLENDLKGMFCEKNQ
ncbi:MAG: ribonuclease P protein component [candidate division Zixibacteria bacterium]|nr:ribonuclease P protein component [candidate division Zixibacteria bacterium]